MPLSDAEFLAQFEQQTLPPAAFDHRGHLRLAWLYLSRNPLERAVDRVTAGIAAYAASLGAADKFHHTLTEAIVRIMSARRRRGHYPTLEAYLAANPDLVRDIRGVVLACYSPELLDSPRARRMFLPPDRAAFD